MEASENGIEELLARMAGPSSDAFRERALFERLSPDKRRFVEERLSVLAPFIEAQDRGEGRAQEAAQALGITPRSLYRLVKRIRVLGAVAALAPRAEAGRKRRSDAGASLSDEVLEMLISEVNQYPHQPMPILVSKAKEMDPGVSASTVRRRVNWIKRVENPLPTTEFGRAWLFDQAAVRLPVETADGNRWLVVALLVDVDSAVICGRAVVEGDRDPGFEALMHALGRMRGLLGTKLRFARRLAAVTWVAPDGWLLQGQAVLDHAKMLRPPVNAEISMTGKFRRGSKLHALLGGTIGFGGSDILIRATVDPQIDGEVAPPPMSEEDALRILDDDLMLNSRWLAVWARPLGRSRTPSRTRVANLQRIMSRLVDVFEPALSQVQLVEARRLVEEVETDFMHASSGGGAT